MLSLFAQLNTIAKAPAGPTANEQAFLETVDRYKEAFGRKVMTAEKLSVALDRWLSNTHEHLRKLVEKQYVINDGNEPHSKTKRWKWNFDRREE